MTPLLRPRLAIPPLLLALVVPAALAACGSSSNPSALDASALDASGSDADAQAAPDAPAPSDAPAGAAPSDASSLDADAQRPDPRIAELLSIASTETKADRVVGAAIALIIDGKLAYAGGIGVRALGAEPVDGDTLFLVGSTTKMLTAATVLSLVDDGKLDLQAPLVDYLPGLTVESPFDAHDMTLSRLLSHTDALEDNSAQQCSSLARFSAYGASGPVTLWGTPGTFFDYSNNDMVLAAQAIESVVGAGGYEQAVHDRVFLPAGMTTATFDSVAATQSADVATGYAADSTGAFTRPITMADTTAICPFLEPAGYAILSAKDFGKFIEILMSGGGTVLSPNAVTQMETGIATTGYNPNWDETYGYALFVDQIGGETVIEHGGDIPPFHSAMFFVPQAHFGIVMLINVDSTKTISKVANAAIALFAPPPGAVAPPVKTPPSDWGPYVGSYVDDYGSLGAFSLTLQGDSLAVNRPDGGSLGALIQINGDYWGLTAGDGEAPSMEGVFLRDDAGAVQQVVSRAGVATRQDTGAVFDAGVGE